MDSEGPWMSRHESTPDESDTGIFDMVRSEIRFMSSIPAFWILPHSKDVGPVLFESPLLSFQTFALHV